MKTTTLNRIRAHPPCLGSWEKLLYGLGKTQADDEPLAFSTILEICGLDDALWATRAEPQYNWRLLAVAFARRVQHLNPDPRVSGCLDVAERYANGQETDEELAEARAAARKAAWAASHESANSAARAAALAAESDAWAAVWRSTRAAAKYAALSAAFSVARCEESSWYAARAAEEKEQEKLFLEFVSQ